MSEESKKLEKYTVITGDKDKIEGFKKDKSEVNILVPIPPVANVYILGVYAALSRVLELLSDQGKIDPDHIKIKFLLMKDVMKKINIIEDPIVDHYSEMIEGLEKVDDTIIEIRSAEFKSLTSTVLIGLNDVKTKEIVLKSLEYYDIEKYLDVKADTDFKKHIEEFRELAVKDGLKAEVPANVKKVSLYDGLSDHKNHPFGFLLQIVNYFLSENKDKDKKIILVVSDVTRGLIVDFFTRYYSGEWSLKNENIAFGDYPDPAKKPEFKEKIPPAYLTILSEYKNKDLDFVGDPLWFAGMLGEYLKCKAFGHVSEYNDMVNKVEKCIEKSNTRIRLGGLSGDKLRKSGQDKEYYTAVNAEEECENSLKKYQDMINKNITAGFLSIQEDIVAQLEFIL